MQTILIVEDEQSILHLLQTRLHQAGYHTVTARDRDEALVAFAQARPALVLLDIHLSSQNGWNVLEEIRNQGSTPVIIVTACSDRKDRLRGLHSGADDYILKPFDPDEVVARVQAVLRRSLALVESDFVRIGSLSVDYSARSTTIGTEGITLAPRDWDLLAFFVRHPNQSFTRSQLLDRVWGLDYEGGDRAVDVAVKRLRKQLRQWPSEEGEIATIRGTGYMLRV